MNKKGERRGGRQKGTPNKLTAEKLLTNYINECLEKRRTYDATENKPEELAAFALCVKAVLPMAAISAATLMHFTFLLTVFMAFFLSTGWC